MAEPRDAQMKSVMDDPALAAALQKASEIVRRPGARAALDRLCCQVYDALLVAVTEDVDLLELVRETDDAHVIALTVGWMLGHPGASGATPEDRQRVTRACVALASVAAGWSVELNHRQARKAVH